MKKIHLVFSCWVIGNVVAFESSTKFHFSTSYDSTTVKLSNTAPSNALQAHLGDEVFSTCRNIIWKLEIDLRNIPQQI